MANALHKQALLKRRKRRVRKHIRGTAESPRLTVYRSLKHISAQLIDDDAGRTLAQASSLSLKIPGGNKTDAEAVGKSIADAAKKQSIESICFDRNGRAYHGRVKALAEAAREAGLKF